MKLSELLRFLRVHRSPIKSAQGLARPKEDLILFLNEAIEETAKILVEQREPHMAPEWVFDVVSGKKRYLLATEVAPGSAVLRDARDLLRPHSLFIKTQNGMAWIEVVLTDKATALRDVAIESQHVRTRAYFELVAGTGDVEGELALVFENPPNWSMAEGARLTVYVKPAVIPDDADDDYEPWLPPLAWSFAKRYAVKLQYLADGAREQAEALDRMLLELEGRMRLTAGGGMSDQPEYVRDVTADEISFLLFPD